MATEQTERRSASETPPRARQAGPLTSAGADAGKAGPVRGGRGREAVWLLRTARGASDIKRTRPGGPASENRKTGLKGLWAPRVHSSVSHSP